MDSSISTVVQGPIDPNKTSYVLRSIRRFLPQSEIVLSTWKGQDLTGLDFDQILENEDPGSVLANPASTYPVYNNLNRQIISTRSGLLKATGKYAFKLRTDCPLHKIPNLLQNASIGRTRLAKYTVSEEPIRILNIYTRNSLRVPVLFHFSDLFMFGLRTDLLKYWSAPLVGEPQFSRALEGKKAPIVDPYPEYEYLFRCAPEQYLGECFAKNVLTFNELKHVADGNIKLLFKSLRILANNFDVLTAEEAGVHLPEKMVSHAADEDLFQPHDAILLKRLTEMKLPWLLAASLIGQYAMARMRHSRPYYAAKRMKKCIMPHHVR